MKWVHSFGIVLLCLALLLASTDCGKSNESSDTTAPSSPANLTCTSSCNDNTPTFAWDAATDDDSGIDYYLVNMDGGEWTNVGDVTTYTLATALSNGSHTFEVKAVDNAGNVSTAKSITFKIDTTPPTISSISVCGITTSSATVTWTTNESATSQVEYGLTASYGSSSVLNSSLVTTHTVSLTGLTAETTYHYRVKSKDACGSEASSDDNTFSTASRTPTGLDWTSSLNNEPDGTQTVWITATWNASADPDLPYYCVRMHVSGDLYRQYFTSLTNSIRVGPVQANTEYHLEVKAVDKTGMNETPFCSEVSHTTVKDTIPPGPPSGLAASAGFSYVWLDWTNPTDNDLAYIEIWRADSNDRSLASKVGETKSNWFSDNVGEYSVTVYYWIRAVDTSDNVSAWCL